MERSKNIFLICFLVSLALIFITVKSEGFLEIYWSIVLYLICVVSFSVLAFLRAILFMKYLMRR